MLYVGIDIAKNKHDLACIDETGEAMITNFRFANSYQGFHHLKSRTNAVVAQQPHPVCISNGDQLTNSNQEKSTLTVPLKQNAKIPNITPLLYHKSLPKGRLLWY